jgi:type II secretory pathway pseudopilin PulG
MSTLVIALIAAAAASAAIVLLVWLRRLKTRRAAQQNLAAEQELQRRVKAAPFRTMVPTRDGRNTFVTVRPTSGDRLPRNVLEELEQYIAQLPAKEIHGRVKMEYRDDGWHPVRRHRGDASETHSADYGTDG